MATRTAPTIELCNERRQSGTATFVSSKTVSVTFASGFTSVPKLAVVALSNPPGGYWVENKTISGFDMRLPSNASISFDWVAIQGL